MGQILHDTLPRHARASHILPIYGLGTMVCGHPRHMRTTWSFWLGHFFFSPVLAMTELSPRTGGFKGSAVDALTGSDPLDKLVGQIVRTTCRCVQDVHTYDDDRGFCREEKRRKRIPSVQVVACQLIDINGQGLLLVDMSVRCNYWCVIYIH